MSCTLLDTTYSSLQVGGGVEEVAWQAGCADRGIVAGQAAWQQGEARLTQVCCCVDQVPLHTFHAGCRVSADPAALERVPAQCALIC